ncbi:hypothetical protein ACKZJ7_15305 [Leptospira sp. 'Mane']
MEASVYRNIRSLHREVLPLTLDDKIEALKSHPNFEILIDKIFIQIQSNGRFQSVIDG